MAEENPRRRGQSRQRMLDGAVQLLRERGAAGVTVDAVLARTGTPRGSVYHHFPGGREEMITAAVRQAGDFITSRLEAAAETGDAQQMLTGFVTFWKQSLADTDYQAGCPIVALAVDSRHDSPQAAHLIDDIFSTWHDALTHLLHTDGLPAARAGRLATLIVAAVEGAVIMCRAHRDAAPLDDVLAELSPLLTPRI